MSKLKQLITDDMKLAMKAQDKPALKAIPDPSPVQVCAAVQEK
jgi:uncharacterized protein YqeY